MTAEIRVVATEALAEAAAEEVAGRLAAAIGRAGRARMVTSGGSTPRPLYRLLASPAFRDRLDWRRVELFQGDERCVPPDHPESNFGQLSQTLLAGVEPAAVHRIEGERPAAEAAALYDRAVRDAAGDPPRFDLALLGIGADGHTASLFPDTPPELALDGGGGRLAVATRSPEPPHPRVSLTLVALGGVERAVFLVAGEGKAEAVARALGPPPEAGEPPPAARVRPAGSTLWLLDRAAAALLPGPRGLPKRDGGGG
jgi:6-phosphogluconolactonase